MAHEWIEKLAQQIKQKNHEAAEDYDRSQHYAGIVAEAGNGFFVALGSCLQEDVEALRRQLQGDSTAAETAVQTVNAYEVKIARARFPWVDARLTHRGDAILLDYAKDPGIHGDAKMDRKTQSFAFRVAPDDSLYVEDGFAEQPQRYEKPENLARHIVELLFAV